MPQPFSPSFLAGKMELFSTAFVRAVEECFDRGHCAILCTIPVEGAGRKPHPLLQKIRMLDDKTLFQVLLVHTPAGLLNTQPIRRTTTCARMLQVTKDNRDSLLDIINTVRPFEQHRPASN